MEAEITFEKENINGIAVVGSYLIDAAHRLGVRIAEESGRLGLDDTTSVKVKSGAEFLSVPNKAELEVLSAERRADGERLADQAKIIGEGEIVIETKDKPEAPKIDADEQYRKDFAELPLEKKVANLLELEAMTLGETFNFILNSPREIVGKLIDVMAEFGIKLDTKPKKEADSDKTGADSEEKDGAEKVPETAENDEIPSAGDSIGSDEAIEAEEPVVDIPYPSAAQVEESRPDEQNQEPRPSDKNEWD